MPVLEGGRLYQVEMQDHVWVRAIDSITGGGYHNYAIVYELQHSLGRLVVCGLQLDALYHNPTRTSLWVLRTIVHGLAKQQQLQQQQQQQEEMQLLV